MNPIIASLIKKNNVSLAYISFFILFSVIIGCSQDKNKTEMATTTTQQGKTAGDTAQQNLLPNSQQLAALPPSKREAFVLMNQLTSKLKYLQSDYANELNSIGWGGILDFKRIKNDKGLVQSDSLLKKASKIIEIFRVEYDAKLDEMKGLVESSSMTDVAKKSFLEGYQKTIAGPGRDSSWLLESQIVSTMKEIFSFLKHTEGKWSIDDEIHFKSNSDQEKLQSYSVKIQSLFIKEEERRKYLAAESVAEVNKLKE